MTKNNWKKEKQYLLDQQEQIIEQRVQQRLRELQTPPASNPQPSIEAELAQAHQQLTFHVENSPLAVIEWDQQFRVKRWSPQAEKIFGWKAEELMARHWNQWEFVHPEDLEQVNTISSRLLNGEDNRNICCNRNYTKLGNLVYCEWYNSVLKNANGQVISLLSLIQDVTIRETAQQELKRRARQQQVIAELGQYALSQTNLEHLAKKVVTLVGQTLGIKYVQIWELLPNQGTFLLTTGLGLRPRSVGRVTLSNTPQSQPGYTLLVKQPVIVENLQVETRFSGSEFFSNHHIVSGVTVLISGKEKPVGVLGIHSQEQRTFSPDEINFLQAVANIIASGVERQQAEVELKIVNQDLEVRVADRTTELIFMNEKLQRQVVELKKIESQLENKANQQAIIAELGQKALSETNLVSLINEVVIQIANNLNVEYCKVLEYSLEDCFLTLAIWDEPLNNYILLSHEPLFSLSLSINQLPGNQDDLISNLFSCSCKYSQDLEPKELNYGKFNFVNQGICIPIRGQNYQQLGQIEIYGKKNQLFREYEVNYLQSVANILATAIERKQTEVTLRFSEERFKITLKNSPIVVFNQDLELRYTWIYNPTGAYESEAVIGQLDFDIFPRENAIQLTQLKQQVLNTKVGLRKEVTTNLEENFQCYDLTVDPLWDLEGNIIGITGAALDITDHKRIEEQLWATTSRLSTLIENLQLGVLVKDEFDKIVLINQAFCNLFNIKESSDRLINMDGKTFSFEYQNLFSDPTQFIIRNQELRGRKRVITNEEISLVDGRTFERDYVPIMIQGVSQGHLWMYRDITERKKAEDTLVTSLREKEVLLKEIHHRVKNNLLVVSNLLEFQSDMFTEPELIKVLDDSRNRIYSMALIHEKLYRSTNLEKINFADYLEDLIDNLFDSYNIQAGQIEFKLDIEPVGLNIETAQPCGLIVNELVSNTLKHAFPNGRSGIVYLGLHQNQEDKIILTVRDNGIGFPAGVDFRNVESLGMELVCTLTEQIEGTITLNQENGTLFTLSFSELQYRHRL
ncbi:PAS domain S-box protein [Planktothrix agardhii]|uniref:PAS domain S-box protein n=1 Tax=Planktothrix agardhii TaxID=1160 RepID=UPI0003F68622|nr:PAS domain S-box protein [Planktothrix agardhii]